MKKEIYLRRVDNSFREYPVTLPCRSLIFCAYGLLLHLDIPRGTDIVAVFSDKPLGKHAFTLTKTGRIKENRQWMLTQSRNRLLDLYESGARYVRVEIAE